MRSIAYLVVYCDFVSFLYIWNNIVYVYINPYIYNSSIGVIAIGLILSNDALEQFFNVCCAECDNCRTTVRTFCRKIAVFVNVIFDDTLYLRS